MTDIIKIEKLLKKLDNHIRFLGSDNDLHSSEPSHPHHTTPESLSEPDGDSGIHSVKLAKDVNYERFSENELILLHSFCHMFKDIGVKGMTKEDIKSEHDKIVLKLSNHSKFDSLDEDLNK